MYLRHVATPLMTVKYPRELICIFQRSYGLTFTVDGEKYNDWRMLPGRAERCVYMFVYWLISQIPDEILKGQRCHDKVEELKAKYHSVRKRLEEENFIYYFLSLDFQII